MELDPTSVGNGRQRLPLQRKRNQLQQQRKHIMPRGCITTQQFVWRASQQRRQGARGGRTLTWVSEPSAANHNSRLPTEFAERRPKTGPTLPSVRQNSPIPWIVKPMASMRPSNVCQTIHHNGREGEAIHSHEHVQIGPLSALFEGEFPLQISHATLHSASKGSSSVPPARVNKPAEVDAGVHGQKLKIPISKQQGGAVLRFQNSTKPLGSVNSRDRLTRPSSANFPPIRGISKGVAPELDGKMTRPRTAGPGIPTRSRSPSSVGSQGIVLDRGGDPPESEIEVGLVDAAAGDALSTEVGAAGVGKVSLAVTLPVLMSPDETRGASRPRSAREERAPCEHCSRANSSTLTLSPGGQRSLEENNLSEESLGWRLPQPRSAQGSSMMGNGVQATSATCLQTQQLSQISFLTLFTRDESEHQGSSRASFHGKALVSSRPAPSSCKRSFTPALQSGIRHDVDGSHPLSPTSTGSPPRQHRNSNWGQEGTRLAPEEEEKSRRTVPFVVSSTLLGWKLSTRARKKTFEEALETSDFSYHNPIPVYGFRVSKDSKNGESEERDRQRRRLGARALAAERAALERRARAEGGLGDVAFARATSTRARARAEWIRKMGDVPDGRQARLCKGSSPQVVKAYRNRVRDRVRAERLRQRALRGLPLRRPPRMVAVTTRADLGESDQAAKSSTAEHERVEKRESVIQPIELEPYGTLLHDSGSEGEGYDRYDLSNGWRLDGQD